MSVRTDALARPVQGWTYLIRIEGIAAPIRSTQRGTGAGMTARNGMIAFCNQIPAYAPAGSEFYVPCLHSTPDAMTEEVDPMGGVAKLGDVTFDLADTHLDLLSTLFRCGGQLTTRIDGAHTSSDTTVDVLDASDIAVGDLIWAGEECMYVTAIATNQLTVERGYGGTNPRQHPDETPVFSFCPYIIGRTVQIYFVPDTATTIADEQELGTWIIDRVSWNSGFAVWSFGARSALALLQRIAPYRPHNLRARKSYHYRTSRALKFEAENDAGGWNGESHYTGSDFGDFYVMSKKTREIFRISSDNILNELSFIRRRDIGLKPSDKQKESAIEFEDPFVEVLVVDGYESSFGYKEVGGGGIITRSFHPVDILLNIITSSIDPDDGYTNPGDNDDATWGDWAFLNSGYGLGIPIGKVDIESFMNVKQSTLDHQCSFFVYGDERRAFSEIADELLKPLGAVLTVASGVIKLIRPRISTTEDDIVEIDKIIQPENTSASVTMVLDGASITAKLGDGSSIAMRSGDYEQTYAKRGLYQAESHGTNLEVPYATSCQDAWVERAVSRKMFRYAQPTTQIKLTTSIEYDDTDVGDIIALTIPELPNPRTGERGCDGDRFLVLSKELQSEGAPTIEWTLIRYTDKLAGTIAPSAITTGVAGNVATCAANRYTAPNAAGGLPVKDVDAFAVGDICKIYTRDSLAVTGTTQTITAINSGANAITFDGNFGGSLAGSGQVIMIADASSSNPRLYTNAWIAGDDFDMSSLKTGDDVDIFGEL